MLVRNAALSGSDAALLIKVDQETDLLCEMTDCPGDIVSFIVP